jgi:hypothetical protein
VAFLVALFDGLFSAPLDGLIDGLLTGLDVSDERLNNEGRQRRGRAGLCACAARSVYMAKPNSLMPYRNDYPIINIPP